MPRFLISILGAGWLGLPLARDLVAAGHQVRASTTSPEKIRLLEQARIIPHRLALAGTSIDGETDGFFDADVLIITVPPSGVDDYERAIGAVAEAAASGGAGRILFTSSTSVYPNLCQEVREEDAGAPAGDELPRNGAAVLAAERAIGASGAETTILRLAGLYGYDRHPANYMAGRTDIPAGDSPVNLVHLDDVKRAVSETVGQGASGVYNVVAPEHPSRREVYTEEARRRGLPLPHFRDGRANWKIVSGERLMQQLGFSYIHPDPLAPAP